MRRRLGFTVTRIYSTKEIFKKISPDNLRAFSIMDTFVWIIVVLIVVATIVLSLLTSVTKWSDKVVEKYAKNDSKELKQQDKSNSSSSE